MVKRKKLIIILTLVAIMVMNFAGTALAWDDYAKAELNNSYGTVYSSNTLSVQGYVTRYGMMTANSYSTYIQTCAHYTAINSDSVWKKLYRGTEWTYSSSISLETVGVKPGLQAIWEGSHTADHIFYY